MSELPATTEPVDKKPPAKAKVTKANKTYVTTSKHTYPIDIQVHGEIVSGQWSAGDGIVEFSVPDHLVEGFEKHYHCVMGNIVAA